ncbi:hypothetical protein SAMN02745174_02071 [Cetobacterium ceti]|uniref:Uncharacterized protein n=1 Tax=Cetobacterium ceti TaxID=180163 RepID=A0A1T4PVS6_9FUSO|nr:hypothetical protein [Cetobacterium ceti]SJZ95660.1 hypothetical protein SAMN02745174_02071 [Cetobacterium ceti]
MNLHEIKIQCLINNISMTQLSKKLGFSREWMYLRIRQQHPETINKIKKILSNPLSFDNTSK